MNTWHFIAIGFAALSTATIAAMVYFVWAIFKGKIELMGSAYDGEQSKANTKIEADLSEVNDPTVWLPKFAQDSKVNAITESRGGWFVAPAQSSRKIMVETVQKSQEQLDEEKRVYFEAKEKRL